MKSLLTRAEFQAPAAKFRSRISGVWRALYLLNNRYCPFTKEETATREADRVPFKGDIPIHAGSMHFQNRLVFRQARPAFEAVADLVVTPVGASWKNGILYEKYSAGKPGLRMLASANRPAREVPAGIFIQSEHTDTFGDWTSEYLAPLARLETIDAPVYLPASLASKPYVKRDSERLGIEFIAIDAPIKIRRAKVVPQPKYIRYWGAEDVAALQQLLGTNRSAPAQGSMVYLSRYGEASEVAQRTHPSLAIEELVKARGGRILRAAETDLADYLSAAQDAETVLFDHGSAGYNMIYWRPRRIIEFASDAWWMNAFLMLADAMGVNDYTIIRSSLGSPEEVAAKTAAALDLPIEA